MKLNLYESICESEFLLAEYNRIMKVVDAARKNVDWLDSMDLCPYVKLELRDALEELDQYP